MLGAVAIVGGGVALVGGARPAGHLRSFGLRLALGAAVLFAMRDNIVRALHAHASPETAAAATLLAGRRRRTRPAEPLPSRRGAARVRACGTAVRAVLHLPVRGVLPRAGVGRLAARRDREPVGRRPVGARARRERGRRAAARGRGAARRHRRHPDRRRALGCAELCGRVRPGRRRRDPPRCDRGRAVSRGRCGPPCPHGPSQAAAAAAPVPRRGAGSAPWRAAPRPSTRRPPARRSRRTCRCGPRRGCGTGAGSSPRAPRRGQPFCGVLGEDAREQLARELAAADRQHRA